MRQYASSLRGERLQGVAENTSSARGLGNSTVSFSSKNECPGTHCSLIVKEERKDSSCQKVSGKRKNGGENCEGRKQEKWQTCLCCRDQHRACRMAQASAEKLEHTGPAEKERVASVPQSEQLARTPELPLPKGKGTKPSVLITRS